MPYRIYHAGDVLRIDLAGIVTNAEFAEMVGKVNQLESSGPVVPHRIADFSQSSELIISYPAIMAAAQLRKALKFPNNFRSAIVATLPGHVSVARTFATLNDHPQISIRVFPTLAEAQAWIAGD